MTEPAIVAVVRGPWRGWVGQLLEEARGSARVRLCGRDDSAAHEGSAIEPWVTVPRADVEVVAQEAPFHEVWHVAPQRPGNLEGLPLRDENALLVGNVLPEDAPLAAAAPYLLDLVASLVEALGGRGGSELLDEAEGAVAWLRRKRVRCAGSSGAQCDASCTVCKGMRVLVGLPETT